MKVPRRAAVRATFALVTVLFLAPFALQHVTREPFPALRGPRFSLRSLSPAPPRPQGLLEVSFHDGTHERLALHALIERVPARQRGWATQALLRAAGGPSRAEVLAWLRDGLAREFPGRTQARIQVFEYTLEAERSPLARATLTWEAELAPP